MLKKAVKIAAIVIAIVGLIAFGLIMWHCNSIVGSMVDLRIEKKSELIQKYEDEIVRVETKTTDGLQISAWQFDVEQPKAIVVILHGLHGMDASSLLEYGKFFKDQGYTSFCLDMRAHGYSEGKMIGLGYTEVKDVSAMLDWIKGQEKYQDKQILLYGLSMGGSTAINTAAQREDVDMVIAVSAYEAFESQVADYMRKSNLPEAIINLYKPCFRIILSLRYKTDPVKFSPINTISQIAPRPIMIIHGDKDSQTSVKHAYNLKEKSGKGSELWIVNDKEHLVITGILNPENKWFTDRIIKFIETNLK